MRHVTKKYDSKQFSETYARAFDALGTIGLDEHIRRFQLRILFANRSNSADTKAQQKTKPLSVFTPRMQKGRAHKQNRTWKKQFVFAHVFLCFREGKPGAII